MATYIFDQLRIELASCKLKWLQCVWKCWEFWKCSVNKISSWWKHLKNAKHITRNGHERTMRTIMITMSLGRVHGQVCTKAITQRIKSIDSKIIRYDFISFISVFRCRFYANYSEIMQQKTIELCNSSCALEENRQRHIFTDELSVNVSPNHGFFSTKESLGR